jgi:mannitol/fructose-specific phosphotransferase system IIA component (Ntr-type)
MCSMKKALALDRIRLLKGETKQDVLEEMTVLVVTSGLVPDAKELLAAILQREALMSTGIGLGIAVPHVRLDGVPRPVAAVGIQPRGVPDYASLDGETVRIIVMVVAGSAQHAQYIRLLASLTDRLRTPAARDTILAAERPETIHAFLTAVGLEGEET